MTPVAAKRLKAIEEYSHLGAGFKIAMRDLEIRGAGNILGPEQSGHIATVGYEMYCQLLEEATRQMKNQPKETKPESHVDIGITALIPKPYIPGDRQRMDVYRRLTRCTSLDMLAGVEQDVSDAFGPPPRQVVILFALTELRLLAGLFGIDSIIRKAPDVVMAVQTAGPAQLALKGAPGTVRVIDDKTVYLRMPATFLESDTLLMTLKNLMRAAYDRERNPAPPPPPKPVIEPIAAATVTTPAVVKPADNGLPAATVRPSVRVRDDRPAMTPKKAKAAVVAKLTPAPQPTPPAVKPAAAAPPSGDYLKLVTLHEQGIPDRPRIPGRPWPSDGGGEVTGP